MSCPDDRPSIVSATPPFAFLPSKDLHPYTVGIRGQKAPFLLAKVTDGER